MRLRRKRDPGPSEAAQAAGRAREAARGAAGRLAEAQQAHADAATTIAGERSLIADLRAARARNNLIPLILGEGK